MVDTKGKSIRMSVTHSAVTRASDQFWHSVTKRTLVGVWRFYSECILAVAGLTVLEPRNIASGRDALDRTEHTNLSLCLRHRNSEFLCSLAFFSSFLSKQENGWLARSRAAECPTDLATDLRQFTSTNQVQNLLTSSCTIMHSTACNKLCKLQLLELSL